MQEFHVLLTGESDNLDSLKEFFGNFRSGECFHYEKVPLNYSINYLGKAFDQYGLFCINGVYETYSLNLVRTRFFEWLTPICKVIFKEEGFRYLRINEHSYRWNIKKEQWELF